jgi:NAD(P)-dependent dehydrogenase (short-subunit alcohol dehydrogenase family)
VINGDITSPKNDGKGDIAFQKTDVTKWADLVALFKAANDKFGSVDMVCANVLSQGKYWKND